MAGRNITATSHSVNATREKANASVTPQNVKAEGGDKATNSELVTAMRIDALATIPGEPTH